MSLPFQTGKEMLRRCSAVTWSGTRKKEVRGDTSTSHQLTALLLCHCHRGEDVQIGKEKHSLTAQIFPLVAAAVKKPKDRFQNQQVFSLLFQDTGKNDDTKEKNQPHGWHNQRNVIIYLAK